MPQGFAYKTNIYEDKYGQVYRCSNGGVTIGTLTSGSVHTIFECTDLNIKQVLSIHSIINSTDKTYFLPNPYINIYFDKQTKNLILEGMQTNSEFDNTVCFAEIEYIKDIQ